jgi:exosortase
MSVESAMSGAAPAVHAEPGPSAHPPATLAGVVAASLGLLVLALYGERFVELYGNWKDDPNYSHGFLVPLVSAFLAYRIYQRQGAPREGNLAAGLFWVVAGGLLHLFAVLIWWPPVDFLALAMILFGAAVAAGGRAWARGFVFPIFFLFFMFPLPVVLVDRTALWLQDTVTGLATHLLGLFIPTFRDGNFIHAAGQGPVEVGEACSGLRQLVAFAALACILMHLVGRSLAYSVLLLLAAPLVAIASNLLRVLLMCLIVRYWGTPWISGAYHDLWGLLTMLIGLGLYLGLAWWLSRVFPEREAGAGNGGKALPSADDSSPGRSSSPGPGLARRLGIAAACLALALGGQATLRAHLHNGQLTPPPELDPNTLSSVPVSLGAWTEAKHLATLPPFHNVDPVLQERLQENIKQLTVLPPSTQSYFDRADLSLYRLYVRPGEAGQEPLLAWLWMVHFKSGEDRNHHPAVCYRVSGKTEDPGGHADVEVPGEKVKLQRFCFTGSNARSYVYYWHYTLEPEAGPDVSALQKIYLTRVQRLPSITVEVFTNAQSQADLDKVADFCTRVHRELRELLPAHSRLGSDILNIRLVETGVPPQG